MGKGDARRPTAKTFDENHDKLDWNNDKQPVEKKPKLECVLNPSTLEWEWVEVQEAPKE